MKCVSIILPIYNSKAYIQETLDSVLAQTYTDWELIVVDDGSPDDSGDICRAITDDRITVHTRQNTGPCRSRNFGISQASGDMIAFIDHDDLWLPTKLATHVAHLEAKPDVGISYGPSQLIDANSKPLGLFQVPKLSNVTARDILCRNPIGNGSVPLIRKEVLDAVKFGTQIDGAPETMYFDHKSAAWEDVELWFRMKVMTDWLFEGIPDCLTQYRIIPDSLASDPEKKQTAFELGLERARQYAPKEIAEHGPAARAYHLRYLARRLIQVGDGTKARQYMHRALRAYPGLIKDDPARTASSLAAVWIMSLMPASLAKRIVDKGVKVTGARQERKVKTN